VNVDLSKVLQALVQHMAENRVRMYNRTYVHAWFEILYNESDRDEIRDFEPFLIRQAKEALDDGLARLNRPSWRQKLFPQWFPRLSVERTQDFWRVDPLPHPNIPMGKLEIHHRVRVGSETARSGELTEVVLLRTETVGTTVVAPPQASSSRAFAVLTCETSEGKHVWRMNKEEATVGRGGLTEWVDMKVPGGDEVSRRHFRIRRTREGKLELRDESTNGTAVNGEPAPKQSWMALTLPAALLLAGKVRIQVEDACS